MMVIISRPNVDSRPFETENDDSDRQPDSHDSVD